MILHMDMDAFFASVEQRDNPRLRGKALVVSGHSKRSVVSTASYEARKFGIHSAMPLFQALRLCPHLTIVSGNREKYIRDSKKIMEILSRFTPLVEPVSIDEAYMDIQGCETLFGSPKQIAMKIQHQVAQELGLTCSIGAAPVRFLAKIASDMNKPNGFTMIDKDNMAEFINTLPIGKVPGVGKQAMVAMTALNIQCLGDIQRLPPQVLDTKFGKMGQRLSALSRGIDPTPVGGRTVRKSISSETTLSQDISAPADIKQVLLACAQRVGKDLRKKRWLCHHVSIKIKFSDFTQITRVKKTRSWISSSNAIYDEARILLHRVNLKKRIRLIGVGVSHFMDESRPVQMSLIPDPAEIANKQWESVDHAVDAVMDKFGSNVIQKATLAQGKLCDKNPTGDISRGIKDMI